VDCDSKNGTLLNGKVLKPFERYKVVDGDEICFGPQTKIVYFSSIAFANFINQSRATSSALFHHNFLHPHISLSYGLI